jgi:hypothetical protein
LDFHRYHDTSYYFFASINDTGNNLLPVTATLAKMYCQYNDNGDETVATISASLHLKQRHIRDSTKYEKLSVSKIFLYITVGIETGD